MKITIPLAFLGLLLSATVHADIWKWVDANGKTHFVDTNTPIFTWVDESDKLHYSDTPDHEDAVAVILVWHSAGSLDDIEESTGENLPGESDEDRIAREEKDAYYCKKATENYDAYKGAPRLYRTNEDGEREYLSESEAKATLQESKQQMDQHCR